MTNKTLSPEEVFKAALISHATALADRLFGWSWDTLTTDQKARAISYSLAGLEAYHKHVNEAFPDPDTEKGTTKQIVAREAVYRIALGLGEKDE